MEKKAGKECDRHPGYLPFTLLAMGMIQPEWIFMTHLFEREAEEKECFNPEAITGPSSKDQQGIRINFRPRETRSHR
ncbi:MAG: hypothetical protein WB502_11580 [Thermoactinomyces sp.]